MARTLSTAMMQAINAQESASAILILLTLSHASLLADICVTSDLVNTTSNSVVYFPFPFMLTLPDDDAAKPPSAKLIIDNIDRSIFAALQLMGTTPPEVTIQLVLAEQPDTVDYGPITMTLRDISIDDLTVEGTLGYDSILNEPFPKDLVTPATVPGVFLIV